ncbi:hypothetical protein NPIL_376081 [Nephila pilipes]|uniref:Uncharacterized protein n=1 Tax=Nephila pilipes TaxID=299642 RepID=A0A8X6NPQ3_NEPPI|nr:hypothetical protein NPIL_376081 [Nephila pilipes]
MIKTTYVITNEEALTAALRKQCGKLWTVLDLTGISVLSSLMTKRLRRSFVSPSVCSGFVSIICLWLSDVEIEQIGTPVIRYVVPDDLICYNRLK